MAEELLNEALHYEEQAKHERDPRLVSYLLRQRDVCLAEACEAEQVS